MTTPEYLTGNKAAIKEFIDKYDVRMIPISPRPSLYCSTALAPAPCSLLTAPGLLTSTLGLSL